MNQTSFNTNEVELYSKFSHLLQSTSSCHDHILLRKFTLIKKFLVRTINSTPRCIFHLTLGNINKLHIFLKLIKYLDTFFKRFWTTADYAMTQK